MTDRTYEPWPALPYDEFSSTKYLLHRLTQVMGKLKLTTPFEPHWGNVVLWLTSTGVTTGGIPYETGLFSVDLDLINHEVICTSSWGKKITFALNSDSVASWTSKLLVCLQEMGITLSLNMMPQEVPNPIALDRDTEKREYKPQLANAWWRIMASSYRVMLQYHSHFQGITPGIGLMWGTFDLRDARYLHQRLNTQGSDFISRNAYDAPQVEVGFWPGDERYNKPAFFSLIYPQPNGIENARIKPDQARWDADLKEFLLDYDDLRRAKNPENDLLLFFESSFQTESEKAGWDKTLITSGEPA